MICPGRVSPYQSVSLQPSVLPVAAATLTTRITLLFDPGLQSCMTTVLVVILDLVLNILSSYPPGLIHCRHHLPPKNSLKDHFKKAFLK